MTPSRLAAGISFTDSGPELRGPPLVLLHGAGGTRHHWPEEIRALPGRRVIALDLPGHGGSPGPALTSTAGYARSVLGLLDALGVERAVMAGLSMGGIVALTLALEAPARVAGLVLAGTGARMRVSPAILQATADPAALAAGADRMAEASFGPGASPALLRELAEGLRAAAPGVVHGDFLACDAFDAMARLGEIRTPALVVCGTEDQLAPPRYSEYLRAGIVGARLELVPGAGHVVTREAPDAVARAIASFLDHIPEVTA